MKKIFLTIMATIPAVAIVASNAKADPMGHMRHSKGKPRYNDLMFILNVPELELSKDQKDKIFNIYIQAKQKIDNLKTELIKVRYGISEELLKDSPDFSKLKDYESKIAQIRSDIYLTTSKARIDAISILTPDQRKKFIGLMKKMMNNDEQNDESCKMMNKMMNNDEQNDEQR